MTVPSAPRPERPHADLLDEALLAAAGRLTLDPEALRWKVGPRIDRRRSTLFPLSLDSPLGTPLSAYYKVPHAGARPDESELRHLERMRVALLRSQTLGRRFAELTEGTDIFVNTTLAMNPDTLEVVTLGLEGRPMGNPLKHALTSGGRNGALKACGRVGWAVRLLERLPAPDLESERDRIWGEAERKLQAANAVFSPTEMARLEEMLTQLCEAALDRPNPVTYAHGDLSPSNVLLMPQGTGLIDFMWVPHLRGFDLARFIHRLRYSALSMDRWTSALIRATLDGYGDPAAADEPGWRFVQLQRSLRTVERRYYPLHRQRRPVRRALADVRAMLADGPASRTE